MATTDLIDLAGARAALRLASGDTTHDADIALNYIPAVTPIVEDVVGPVVSRSFTHTVDGGEGSVALPHVGVSVTSVTEDGTALTVDDDFVVDDAAGVVYAGPSGAPTTFAIGRQNIVVTYTAGVAASTAAVPANIKLAARLVLAALWQADQQGSRPQFGTNEQGTTRTPSGYAIPARAYQLLEPSDTGRAGGFA